MKKSFSILLIDDDVSQHELLRGYFGAYGHRMASLLNGSQVVSTLEEFRPDIVLLDLILPGTDGLEILREIRSRSDVPVIMLTARNEEEDRIVGLEVGADDYLGKPFNPRELLARIRATLRLQHRTEKSTKPSTGSPIPSPCIVGGGLSLRRLTNVVSCAGKEVELSTAESMLLSLLMEHSNRALSREEIMTLMRGDDFVAFQRTVDVHISKLRSKLEKSLGKGNVIRTVHGVGYMFVDESAISPV